MTDIERELRELLNRKRAEVHFSGVLSSRAMSKLRRRRAATLLGAAFLLIAAVSVGVAGGIAALREPDVQPAAPGWVKVEPLEELERSRVIYLAEHRVFVVIGPEGPLALSGLSPHLGDQILYCPTSGMFEALHGEKFDRLGYYFAGPAPRGMDRVATRVEDGVVQIEPSRVTEGPARSAREPMQPLGRFCNEEGKESRPGFAAPRGEVVATGQGPGFAWTLTAYEDDGWLCTEYHLKREGPGSVGGGICGRFRPRRIGFTVGKSSDTNMPTSTEAYGWVHERVASLYLELAGENRMRLRLYPASRALGFPAKFFVVTPLPRNAVSLVAFDQRGELVDEKKIPRP